MCCVFSDYGLVTSSVITAWSLYDHGPVTPSITVSCSLVIQSFDRRQSVIGRIEFRDALMAGLADRRRRSVSSQKMRRDDVFRDFVMLSLPC